MVIVGEQPSKVPAFRIESYDEADLNSAAEVACDLDNASSRKTRREIRARSASKWVFCPVKSRPPYQNRSHDFAESTRCRVELVGFSARGSG